MSRLRLSSANRRASIVAAARTVFACYGLEGARTQQIAKAAGISEALLFQHFASKTHLYRAVLRDVIVDQNRTFRAFGAVEPSTDGLLEMVLRTVRHAMLGPRASNSESMRIVVGSLAADGHYARLVYRRSLRLAAPSLSRALDAAAAEGGLVGRPIAVANAVAFLEHVGTMLMIARSHARPVVTYGGDDIVLMRDAIAFCARGIGIDPDRVDRFVESLNA